MPVLRVASGEGRRRGLEVPLPRSTTDLTTHFPEGTLTSMASPDIAEPPMATTEELVRAGILRAPESKMGEAFWRLPRPADTGGLTVRALLEERRFNR
jgi:hypothetical protein